MAITGNLDTMPLAELFQWAGGNRKAGILRVSNGRNTLQFMFAEGRLVGCTSDDPRTLLGQFLLSRGKIDESTLQQALARQDQSGENLATILVDMGAIAREEIDRCVQAKAEELVFKLFEWKKADFEFDSEGKPAPSMIKVDVDVEDILLRGAQRLDELDNMKRIFDNPGIVMCRTDNDLPPSVGSKMARRIYDLVDGSRTFAEILLKSRASEFLATKFLYELYRRNIICIKDVHQVAPERGTPEAARDLALGLMSRGEHEAALDVLQNSLADNSRNELLDRTLAKIEAAYLENAYQCHLPASRIPVPIRSRKEVDGNLALSANELFVLDLLEGGRWDVKSLVRIAPLLEIELVRALKELLDKGLIELRDEATVEPAPLPEIFIPGLEDDELDLNVEIEKTLDGIMEAGGQP